MSTVMSSVPKASGLTVKGTSMMNVLKNIRFGEKGDMSWMQMKKLDGSEQHLMVFL